MNTESCVWLALGNKNTSVKVKSVVNTLCPRLQVTVNFFNI